MTTPQAQVVVSADQALVIVTQGSPGQVVVAPATVPLSGYLPLAGGVMTGGFSVAPVTLTDAGTISVNAALSNDFRVTLGGDRTLGTPSNPADAQRITVEVIQPASGGPYTLAYSGGYEWSAAIPAPTLSTAANAHDFLGFIYNANTELWYGVAAALGY